MKKAIVILLALLCIAPVFAAKKSGIEAGLELGYADVSTYVHAQYKGVMDPRVMHAHGFEFGANAKYDIDKGLSAYGKFGYSIVSSVSGKVGETKKTEKVPDEINVYVLRYAAGVLYDLDVDFGVDGLAASVGGGVAFNSYHQVSDDGVGKLNQYYSALAVDLMVEVEYEVADGIIAFVDFEPQISLVNGGGRKYSAVDTSSKLVTTFQPSFGFSATAGARYAF